MLKGLGYTFDSTDLTYTKVQIFALIENTVNKIQDEASKKTKINKRPGK